ncbi:melanoma-associated antigen 10-like [Heterocephalus glaber]|uniref:Melanoma-associated antigen 10-like n=1 Tax=Heterocephalus glaber TaxID=10181 RepID=A0AAX6S7Q2_HETGA|nr:melanoma-associated antigen 10-like [Heterocephalus glaber]XP_021104840.1 melanoma-associated antigen 10-like [Heterocephalus glaber]XP_021104841.1 melanoma-associated antigen 10-like [Heterocephalus glaber]XP_021104843.1 melanoma-associated antigen 10-like [Heterocephalus glaber]
MASSQRSQSSLGFSREHKEHRCTLQDQEGPKPLPLEALRDKVDELVDFLLLKYSKMELTTKVEMLYGVTKDYQEHFPLIFRKASECLYLVFGIDVKEVDPPGNLYVLVPVLCLTYNGMLGNEQGIPKTSLLIIILSIIFVKGNRASEEVVWLALNRMQVYDGREHLVYGEPRKFITEELVEEGYLEYRQVPDSDPARYEFLWGPRAHAETTKMKVLEHLSKVNKRDPRSYPRLYEEALRAEQEAAMDGVGYVPEIGCIWEPLH